MILIMDLEKLKLKIEIVKYKITLFASGFSGTVYLLLNKRDIVVEKTNENVFYINEDMFYIVIGSIFLYSLYGFFTNLSKINLLEKDIKWMGMKLQF